MDTREEMKAKLLARRERDGQSAESGFDSSWQAMSITWNGKPLTGWVDGRYIDEDVVGLWLSDTDE